MVQAQGRLKGIPVANVQRTHPCILTGCPLKLSQKVPQDFRQVTQLPFFFSFLLRNSILRHNSADKLFLHKEISYLSGTSCPRDSVHWRDYQLLGHPWLPASKSRLPRVLSLSLLLGISQTASLDQPREISTTEVRKEDMTTILNGQAPPASTPQTDMRDWKTMSVYFYNLLS